MEIGNDDLDYIEDVEFEQRNGGDDSPQYNEESQDTGQEQEQGDYLSRFLESRGIQDMSKIKFENEDGEVEEVDWENLSDEDKLNILNTTSNDPDTDLDDDEVDLINAVRRSGLTPREFLRNVGKGSVSRYIQNNAPQGYNVDQYNDDELFIADFMSRTGDVTQEEAAQALETAKQNQALYQKQIDAIRKEYKTIEEENRKQLQLEQQEQFQQRYEQFANSVVDEISNLKEFQGYDLDLEDDDMQELYEFIVGRDAAGNNHFAKALSDPKTLVETAWLALNGKKMVDDITSYFQKEITKVRKESYKKGLADAGKKQAQVVFRDKGTKKQGNTYDDIDDII